MICPGCNGAKTFTGFVCRYKSDGGHGSVETYNCHTCDGTGEITTEHHERIAAGRKQRDERVHAHPCPRHHPWDASHPAR